MQHEIILKRSDGTKYRINASVYLDSISGAKYFVSVYVCANRGKKWRDVHNSDDYSFRSLNSTDRLKHIESRQLEFVTADEILQAKTELWQKMKP